MLKLGWKGRLTVRKGRLRAAGISHIIRHPVIPAAAATGHSGFDYQSGPDSSYFSRSIFNIKQRARELR